MLQALTLNTLSKLTFEDSKRFSMLIDNVFPDIKKDTMQVCFFSSFFLQLILARATYELYVYL